MCCKPPHETRHRNGIPADCICIFCKFGAGSRWPGQAKWSSPAMTRWNVDPNAPGVSFLGVGWLTLVLRRPPKCRRRRHRDLQRMDIRAACIPPGSAAFARLGARNAPLARARNAYHKAGIFNRKSCKPREWNQATSREAEDLRDLRLRSLASLPWRPRTPPADFDHSSRGVPKPRSGSLARSYRKADRQL